MKSLHHAPWIVPVTSPAIADGAIICSDSAIIEIGTFAELSRKHPDAKVNTHADTALTPALINAHIHLELSHIPIPQYMKEVVGFTDWINTLLSQRAELGDIGQEVETAAGKTLQQQHQQGVIALGDIGNTNIGYTLQADFPGEIIHFNERLGRSKKTRRSILNEVAAAPQDKLFTAHAPYSTHPELIQALKKRAVHYDHPFPLHVAEPPAEKDMICCGTGELTQFFKERGFIDNSYVPPAGIDIQGSVQYLHELGVLDKRTICVHSIHVTEDEIQMLADSRSHVCLCPGSNQYLRVGHAPVEKFIQAGILPALGTDSVASNPELSLWREMTLCHENSPQTHPKDIFAMATIGGARALGIDERYGSLAPGKSADFLGVPLAEKTEDETMLYQQLINTTCQPYWVKEQ